MSHFIVLLGAFLLILGMASCFVNPTRTTHGRRNALAAQLNKDLLLTLNEEEKETLSALTLVSGPLGTLLDSQHGCWNTLNYQWFPIIIESQGHTYLKTSIWVAPMFAFAGLTMSYLTLKFDKLLETTLEKRDNSWSKVFQGIATFSLQYYLSGLLDASRTFDPNQIHVLLAAIALVNYKVFDNTKSGLLLAIATAVSGPMVEIGIINTSKIYEYTNADFYGIDSWIPAVYFMGGAALANLTRRIYLDKLGDLANETEIISNKL